MEEKNLGKMTIPELIDVECENVKQMLISKNQQYGNSFADPVRIFSRATPEEGLNVRIDDKLSRIARGHDAGEDSELDLIGYLILKRVLGRMSNVNA
jgi:hypothetical protein